MGMGMGDTQEGAFGAAGPMSHRSRAGEQTLNCLPVSISRPNKWERCWGWVFVVLGMGARFVDVLPQIHNSPFPSPTSHSLSHKP